MPNLNLDPATEARLTRFAQWYDVPVERYAEILLERAFDQLVTEMPNLAPLLELP